MRTVEGVFTVSSSTVLTVRLHARLRFRSHTVDSPMEDIIAEMKAAGPSGFDPRSSVEVLQQPGLWVYGGKDLSHPTMLSVEILEEIMAVQPKEWTILVFPNANHDFVENGGICQEEGPFTDAIPPLRDWLTGYLCGKPGSRDDLTVG